MKTLLLSLVLLFTANSNAQTTTIPDANFEQVLITLGYDSVLDGSVLTANIINVTYLYLVTTYIDDLTGIEDFAALVELNCANNNLSNLNLTQNTNLEILKCEDNYLTSLDLSQNTSLVTLQCQFNSNLNSLDLAEQLIEYIELQLLRN